MTLTSKDNPEVRLDIRIDSNLRRQLKAKAALRGQTMSDTVRDLIAEWVQKARSTEEFLDTLWEDNPPSNPYCLQCKAALPAMRTQPGPIQPCPSCGHYGYEFKDTEDQAEREIKHE